MRVIQTSVGGENFVGLIGLATDAYAIVCPGFRQENILDVPTLKTKCYGTNLLGMFMAGNSNGLLIPYFAKEDELVRIREFGSEVGFEVGIMQGKNTALGNLIVSNDKGAMISESIRDYETVESVLGVEAVSGDIDGHSEVGAWAFATNRGFIAHPKASQQMGLLEDALKVQGEMGTVNYGVPFVKSGLIGNSNGYITGRKTTGIELSQIDSALGFI